MTTKLQLLRNPLVRAPHNFFPANSLCYLEIVDPLMERSLDSLNLESMRKTMQMQEEIFKQQVEELHRLYNLQKKLMQEVLQNGLKRKKETLIEAQTDKTGHLNFQVFNNASRDDENGSCSGESSKLNPIKFDLERPTESAPSNIQRINSNDDDENDVEVELTLSIGNYKHKRSKSQPNKGEEEEEEESGESSSVIISRSNSSTVYKENTRPHWLMQDLSLNRT